MWEPGTAIAGSCRGRAGCRPVCSGNRSRCGGSCRMPGNANTRFCTPNNRQNAPDEPPQWEENALARHLNFQQIPQTSETHRPQARTQKGLNQPQKRGLPPKSRALKKPPTIARDTSALHCEHVEEGVVEALRFAFLIGRVLPVFGEDSGANANFVPQKAH